MITALLAVLCVTQGTAAQFVVSVAPAPAIAQLSPATGAVGATVIITGTNFNASQGSGSVSFNGVTATASSWSTFSITVTVPVGATTGNVVVRQNGFSSAGAAFTVSVGGGCDQSFPTGNNAAIVTALGQNTGVARNLCLSTDGGNYGSITISNVSRTVLATLKPTPGQTARISPQLDNDDFIKFEGLILTGVNESGCSTHLEFWTNTWVEGLTGVFLNEGSCGAQALLFDGNSFVNLDLTYADERFGTEGGVNGLILRNNNFANSGAGAASGTSGGIHLGGGQNIVIGPGNTFIGLTQAICDADMGQHCDGIQCNGGCNTSTTIKQNYFANNTTPIMAPDGSNNLLVENNVFDNSGQNYTDPIQFGHAVNAIFRHNTVRCCLGLTSDSAVNFDSKPADPASSGVLMENNVMQGAGFDLTGGNGCTGCTTRYTVFSVSGYAVGTNQILGTPTYVGGTLPTTWAGWQLAGGSPGKNAGNDGLDVGTTYYGP